MQNKNEHANETRCAVCIEYNWSDPLEIYYGESDTRRFCILHAPSHTKEHLLDKFTCALEETIGATRQKTEQNENNSQDFTWINLSGTIFPLGFTNFSFLRKLPPAKINLSNCEFNDECMIMFKDLNHDITFKNSIFRKNTLVSIENATSSINFCDATFHGLTSFFDINLTSGSLTCDNTVFVEHFVCTNSTFGSSSCTLRSDKWDRLLESISRLSFDNATFNKNAKFSDSKFNIKSLFNLNSRTDRPLDKNNEACTEIASIAFINVCFNESTKLTFNDTSPALVIQDCTFLSPASFNGSTFPKKVDISNTSFYFDVDFSNSTFNYLTTIRNTGFMSRCDFSGVSFNERTTYDRIATSNNSCVLFRFIHTHNFTIIRTKMDMFDFLYTDISNITFSDAQWSRHITSERYEIAAEYEAMHANHATLSPYENSDQLLNAVVIFYRQMKKKCRDEQNDAEASLWHYAEKEVSLRQLQTSSVASYSNFSATIISTFNRHNNERDDPNLLRMYWAIARGIINDNNVRESTSACFHRLLLTTYRTISRYGEDPKQALLILLFLASVLAVLVLLGSVFAPEPSDNAKALDAWRTFHVFFQYLLLDRPSYELNPFFAALALLLSRLLIPIQAAIFAFALRNKLHR